MAVKPIIEVQVDTGDFDKFKKMYDAYAAELKKLPGAWSAASDAIGAAGEETSNVEQLLRNIEMSTAATAASSLDILDHMTKQGTVAKEMQKVNEKKLRTEQQSSATWVKLRQNTYASAKSIHSATLDLMKWVGIVDVLGGIVGAGSIWGIDRLAKSASNQARSAKSLGVTSGEEQAFNVDFGRFFRSGDASGFLGGVNDAQNDYNKRVGLYSLGFSDADIEGKDSATLAAEALPKLQRFLKGAPKGGLANYSEAFGLNEFGSLQDLETILNSSPADLQNQIGKYGTDRKTFQAQPDAQQKMQELVTQLDRAGASIQTVLIDDLSKLAPGLSKISESFTTVVDSFLRNPNVGKWLDGVDASLETFAKYVGSDRFSTDIKTIADDVGYAAKKFASALRWLGIIPDEKPDPTASSPQSPLAPRFAFGETGGLDRPSIDTPQRSFNSHFDQTLDQRASDLIPKIQTMFGVSRDAASGIASSLAAESNGLDFNAVNPTSGASGLAQWLGSRKTQLMDFADAQGKNWRDPNVQLGFLNKEIHSRDFSGVLKELQAQGLSAKDAADIWTSQFEKPGPGHLKDHNAYADHFSRLKDPVPAPASNPHDVVNVLKGLRAQQSAPMAPVHITVNNNTGGSAVISTAQLAQ